MKRQPQAASGMRTRYPTLRAAWRILAGAGPLLASASAFADATVPTPVDGRQAQGTPPRPKGEAPRALPPNDVDRRNCTLEKVPDALPPRQRKDRPDAHPPLAGKPAYPHPPAPPPPPPPPQPPATKRAVKPEPPPVPGGIGRVILPHAPGTTFRSAPRAGVARLILHPHGPDEPCFAIVSPTGEEV